MFFGSTVLVFAVVLKVIPENFYDKLAGAIVVDEDKDAS